MNGNLWSYALLAVAAIVGLVLAWKFLRARRHQQAFSRAREDFHRVRERLEAQFHRLAASSGKPRGLEWVDCEFADEVAYARDRQSGELAAFVGVAIRFAAIEGGDMEDVEAVSNIRSATAVFLRRDQKWITEGRAIFNLSPPQAIERFGRTMEPVPVDAPARS